MPALVTATPEDRVAARLARLAPPVDGAPSLTPQPSPLLGAAAQPEPEAAAAAAAGGAEQEQETDVFRLARANRLYNQVRATHMRSASLLPKKQLTSAWASVEVS